MPTINQLPVLNTISSGDQLPVYSPNNGDARRTSIGSLLTYFQQTFASPTLSTNLYVPTTGFNITVPTPVSNDQWMLLQPAGTLATGTITLPLNTGVPDGTTVLITTTQQITLLTLALNGATAIFGGVTSLAAGTATAIRFYQATNSWYQLNSETVYGAGVQSFLATPSSANLAAAVTDETGTGSLVFATGPTITLTNATGLPIATGVSGLGANVATFLATPSSANLAAAVTDETGTGNLVFSATPTFTGTVNAATIMATGDISGSTVAASTSVAVNSLSKIVAADTGSIAAGGTYVITLAPITSGQLNIYIQRTDNGSLNTRTLYFASNRYGSNVAITSVASTNGSSGAAPFSVSTGVDGSLNQTVTITNTHGSSAINGAWTYSGLHYA
jgi:hypothetical protein